ncbi:MAG: hypothetical protein M3220_10975 [Chloroflexota bacterium]|nr:hypothetical protein [Chloroflexota bacterium]
MDHVPEDRDRAYGESRTERLEEEGLIVESDMPPPEYKQARGEVDADLAQVGHIYPALVTAHFPDAESADRAIAQLQELNLTGAHPIQRFDKEEPETRFDVNDPGLEPGEVAVIAQLEDESQGEEAVRICEEAGAKHARFYPAQRIGEVAPPQEE